ncbi:MAG: trigger factor [Betaproteobacteria bacterium]|nr:trigger factor [Betaproteobacteria bacterium]
MAATLENISQLERRLNITLPAVQIDDEVQSRLKRLARSVKMHGFRPGKVPLKVIAQQYEDQVRREVLGDALQKSFGDAIREQNFKVAGYPRFEPRTAAESAPQFEFSATFEIYPEIAVGDLSTTAITRPTIDIGEAEVDRTLEIMRKQRAAFEPVARAAALGDKATLDFAGRIDGHEFDGGKGENFSAILGEGRLLKDFESHVVGMAAGEARTFEIRFPEDYHGKEMAGKTATFDVKLKQIAEPKLPPIDAEFAKSLGVADGNLDTMRREVRENLERETKRRISGRLKDQIMQALIDMTRIEVPKSLVELEIERMTAAARRDLEARGVKPGAMPPIPRETFEQQAQRRVTLGLILAEVVKTNGLQAKPEQVRALVEEQAQTYEQPEQWVKWFYQAPERLREVESLVLEDNVVAWVLATAKVEDKPIVFDELMGNA